MPVPSQCAESKKIPTGVKEELHFIKKNFKDVKLGLMMVRANMERLRLAIERLEEKLRK